MATTQEKWQEIANRGLQDKFDPTTRAKFDEAVRRGLITMQQPNQEQSALSAPELRRNNDPDQQGLGVMQEPAAPIKPIEDPAVTDEIIGGLDTAKTIVSSAVAEPVAGIIGGIETGGRAILNALGFDAGDPTGEGTKTINAVRDFIQLEPSTEEGQRNLEVIGGLVKRGVDVANIPVSGLVGIGEILSGQGLDQAATSVKKVKDEGLSTVLGQRTLDATGSPALAAIAHSLPTAALEAIGVKGLKTSKLANEKLSTNIAEAIQQAAPDIKEIQKAKTTAYAELDKMGVKVKAEVYDNFANRVNGILKKEGVDPTLTPKSSATLKRIMEDKGSPKSLSELDTIRKIAKGAANDIDKTDARLGNFIINELDKGIENLSTQIGGKFKEARGLAQRAFKSQDITDMMENASHTASGLENGLRIEARKLLKNKKRRKGFTPQEMAALRKIEQGTTLGNISKFLGKFGISENQASSMLGASVGAGGGGVIGSIFGGPIGAGVGAVGVPALGQIAKKTAQRITLNNTKFTDDLVRAGKNSEEVAKAYLKNTPIAERRVSDLTDLLMDPNLTGGDVTKLIKGNNPTSKLLSDSMFFVTEINRRLKQGASTAAILQPEIETATSENE
jgi:hypothetical protein